MTAFKPYTVTLSGCDDHTDLPLMLNDEQAGLVRTMCELSKRVSTYGCMPIMVIEEGHPKPEDEDE